MKEVAPGVFQLKGFPPNAINVWLMGDVLVDASTKLAGRRILSELEGRPVTAHALTHAHPDHQGASHEVCTKLGIPFWVGERDVAAAEGGIDAIKKLQPKSPINNMIAGLWGGPGHPVDRALKEGDEVAGFSVLDVPGHSAGHVAYWRESDGVLILGDVVNTMNLVTTVKGLREPPKPFTPDPVTNRTSIRKLAALQPALVLAGHGPPWRDAQAFSRFADGLPTD
jgi:glyoxylase-like metal-dependent hydrolase (beta-lactamase superfamily II)